MKNKKIWTKQETVALLWLLGATLIVITFSLWQNLNIPVFTLLFLSLPLANLLIQKDAKRIGMGWIGFGKVIKWAGINLGILILIYAIFEPWSGAYAFILKEATGAGSTDPTFAWLTLFEGICGWLGMFLFSGLFSIFAEEVCFRGWLLRTFTPKVGPLWSNLIQAALFTLPQLIVVFLMPSPIMGVVYGLVYAFIAIGMINGWVSRRAGAIWPNLIAAAVMNLILSVLILR